MMELKTKEQIIKASDYNKIASAYGKETFSLKNNEYVIICNHESIAQMRNVALNGNTEIEINGEKLRPKYESCKDGYIEISTSETNVGIIIVPDSLNLSASDQQLWFLSADYSALSKNEREKTEAYFADDSSSLVTKLNESGSTLKGVTKIHLIEASIGLSTIIVFIAIYLGIVFLIVSCAVLALKQLTESSDNRQRYIILRKIGCDEKMINKALFRQIAVFFCMPLVLAIIHSVFGIQFALSIFETIASISQLVPSVIASVIVIGAVYACYFIATYLGSKNIIKEEN